MNYWILLIAIIGLILIGTITLTDINLDFLNNETKIELNTNLLKDSINAGENATITFSANSSNPITSITVKVQDDTQIIECNSNSCSGEIIQKFNKPGAYTLTINAIGEHSTEQKKHTIYVIDKQKCNDGTPLNNCSTNKPFYCKNNNLIEKCTECGCDSGKCQENGKCSQTISLKINSTKINDFNTINANTPFSLVIQILNNSNQTIAKNTALKLEIKLFNEQNTFTNSYNFSPTNDLAPESTTEISILYANNSFTRFLIPEQGTYELEAKLLGPNNEEIHTKNQQEFLKVINDSTPPTSPTGLNATQNGNKILLSWNPNTETDTAGYNIYQSANITTIFITSNKIGFTTENSFQTKELEQGTYYYVITAIDVVGNESEFSQQTTNSIQ